MRITDIDVMLPNLSAWNEFIKKLQKKKNILIEGMLRRKNGTTFYVEVSCKLISHENQEYAIGIARDITERKNSQMALQKSEEKYSSIIRNSLDGFFRVDNKGRFLEVNDAYCGMIGYTRDELINMSVAELESLEIQKMFLEHISNVKKKGYDRFQTKYKRKDEKIIDVNVALKLSEDREYIYSFIKDITQQKSAEEEIEKEKLLIEDYINSLPGLFYVFDKKQFIQWNKQWETVTGYSADELKKMYGTDFFDGKDKALIENRMKKVFSDGSAIAEAELVTKQGKRIPYYFTGLRKECNGKPYLIGLGVDISERKKMEDMLKISAERFERWKSSNFIGILHSDVNGKIVDMNDTLLKIIGYSRQELDEGKIDWRKLTPPEFACLDKKAIKEAKKNGFWTPFEKEYIHKDGHRVPIIIGGSEFENTPGEYIVFIVDNTERFNAKQRLEIQTYEIRQLSHEIENTQMDILQILGSVVENRSREVSNHVKRVAEISYLIAIEYGLSQEDANLLRKASPMHDIGKIGISDSILNKPGELTKDEFELVKTHTIIGHSIMQHSQRELFKASAIISLQHHEKWDGSGYPNNISGENIHIFGRITAIADVFDALIHERVYKQAWSLEDALKEINLQKGKQFEPKIVDIFNNNVDPIFDISKKYMDDFNIKSDLFENPIKEHVVKLLSNECIILGGNPAKCPDHKLRALPFPELIHVIDKLSEEECQEILNKHLECINKNS